MATAIGRPERRQATGCGARRRRSKGVVPKASWGRHASRWKQIQSIPTLEACWEFSSAVGQYFKSAEAWHRPRPRRVGIDRNELPQRNGLASKAVSGGEDHAAGVTDRVGGVPRNAVQYQCR